MIRAVICDVYRTVLEVLPAPADAEMRWNGIVSGHTGIAACSLMELSQRCREIVAADHAEASARGVAFPEVVWPEVMARALPGFDLLDAEAREEFIFAHMQLLREVRLMRGAAEFLRSCGVRGQLLGIASNAQHYTLRELAVALETGDLGLAIFDSELTLWSWQLGFSKPNPHLFQILAARLAHRGIRAEETLMVGDRLDNDMEPAGRFGWQTARVADDADWRALSERLFREP